jgi:two-component system OmpR family response regulator
MRPPPPLLVVDGAALRLADGGMNTYDPGMRVLLIEDDKAAASYVAKGLQESGHNVDVAHTGRDGLLMAAGALYDALIVDRMLPGLDGLGVVKTLRATGNRTPVLFLSALGEVDDRVKGLKAGGDDYVVKPFAFSELLARLEALNRRAGQSSDGPETVLRYDDLMMDLLARRVERGGREIDLQPREFRLLEVLLRHAGQVMTRTMLLEKVWDYRFDPQTNVIDVHISRLRQKIDRGFDRPLIHTVRGAGYSLRAPDKAA